MITHIETVCGLEVLLHGKFKLLDEDLFEGVKVFLLVENEHCLLIVNGVNGTETE